MKYFIKYENLHIKTQWKGHEQRNKNGPAGGAGDVGGAGVNDVVTELNEPPLADRGDATKLQQGNHYS